MVPLDATARAVLPLINQRYYRLYLQVLSRFFIDEVPKTFRGKVRTMVVLPSFGTGGAVLPLTDGRYYRSGGRGQRYCCLVFWAADSFIVGMVVVAVVPLQRYCR